MKLFVSLVLVLIPYRMAFAQLVPPRDTLITNNELLDEVTISASRISLRPDQLPQKIQVISQEDIQMNTFVDIGDVIKKETAIDVIQYPQALSYISIRGFRPPSFAGLLSPESSVLINGRQSGTYNLALIDPNSIERIEVLKGAAAAMYGSSAMGGVVNIITKKTEGPVQGQVYGGYGAFQTTELGLSVGGSLTKRLSFDLSGTMFDRNADFRHGDGNLFRRLLGAEEVTLTLADGTQVTEDDRILDGEIRNHTRMGFHTGMARVGYEITESWRASLMVENYTARNIETAGDWHYGDNQRGISGRGRSAGELAILGEAGAHNFSFRFFSTRDDSKVFDIVSGTNENTVPVPMFQRSQSKVLWQGFQLQDMILASGKTRFVVGLDYTDARTDLKRWAQGSAADGYPVSRTRGTSPDSYINSLAPFAQAHFTLADERLIVNPAVRLDMMAFGILESFEFTNIQTRTENNFFVSPSLGLQYRLLDRLSARGNIGRAFRYPRAFEVAGYLEEYLRNDTEIRLQIGNPDLRNEESITWDLGTRFEDATKGYRFDLTYFHTDVRNRVRFIDIDAERGQAYVSPINGQAYVIDRYRTFTNADKSAIRGLELEAAYDLGATRNNRYGLRLFLNGTHFLRAEDVRIDLSAATPDDVAGIRNVASTTLGYGIEYDNYKNFRARLTGRFVGARLDNDFGNLDPVRRGALIEYTPYMTLDLVAAYTFQQQHTVSVRISNLTDENFYEKRGFNMPGRYAMLRYTLQFGQ